MRDQASQVVEKVEKRQWETLAGKSMLHRLGAVEADLEDHTSYTGSARWMIPYADLLTLLVGLFMVLLAMSVLDNKSLTQETEKTRTELAELRSQLKEFSNVPIPSVGVSSQMIALGNPQVRVFEEKRGLVISMMDGVLFPSGSAELTPSARQTLDRLAEVLKTTPHPIRVEGHTDNTPIATSQYPSNWELSTARSTRILSYLVTRHHFSPRNLSAAGYGEFRPVTANSSIEGKQKNRRVDIVILNKTEAGMEPHAPDSSGGVSGR